MLRLLRGLTLWWQLKFGWQRLVALVLPLTLMLSACQPRLSWGDEQKLLSQAWTTLDRAYVDASFNDQNWWEVRQAFLRQPMPDREVTYAKIVEMMGTLGDPFTRFLDPEAYRSLQTSTAGALSGVGLQIALDEAGDRIRVLTPIEDSPAARAGLMPDDIILCIDGTTTAKMGLDEAAALMRGTVGSSVRLEILRSERPFDVVLERADIEIDPVRTKIIKNAIGRQSVAYIRLNQFNGNAVDKVAEAITQAENERVVGYVLDLRGNPGGLLRAGIEIAQMWLADATIVYTIDRNGVQDSARATGNRLTEAPLVVLVNRGSASASEVLAGALQDNHRAVLVGTRTFGKGSIQSLFELTDGSGMAVTIAKYMTPAKRDINKLGIDPDIEVELPDGELLSRDRVATAADRQFVRALQALQQVKKLALVSRHSDAV
ncbi:MAG: S41 family peptidase [Cyanobacteria bacterium P01_F01_bin.33]